MGYIAMLRCIILTLLLSQSNTVTDCKSFSRAECIRKVTYLYKIRGRLNDNHGNAENLMDSCLNKDLSFMFSSRSFQQST